MVIKGPHLTGLAHKVSFYKKKKKKEPTIIPNRCIGHPEWLIITYLAGNFFSCHLLVEILLQVFEVWGSAEFTFVYNGIVGVSIQDNCMTKAPALSVESLTLMISSLMSVC